jgi:hypothetical protein
VTDIVKRLRMDSEPTDGDMETAIGRIRRSNAQLRAALAEIRDADANLGPMHDWADEKFQAFKAIASEALEGTEL